MSGGSDTSSPERRFRPRVRIEQQLTSRLGAAGLRPGAHPHVLVAVSGGSDSSALLAAAARLMAGPDAFFCVTACHVDHGLRLLEERAAEQALLTALCRRLQVPLHVVAVDVAGEQGTDRLSWEDAARRCRYAALGDLAGRVGATVVVTGHTRDDQVETVLMRVSRGTGLRGLRGIDAVSRPWGAAGPALVRPMLSVTRQETEAYCRDRGIAWSVDSSNASARFTRSRVRHELLPVLTGIYPSAASALLRLAGQAGDFTEWLDHEVEDLLDRLWIEQAGMAVLALPPTQLPAFLRDQVVAAALTRLLQTPGPPSERLVTAVAGLWQGRMGRRLAVGRGWHAEATPAGLHFRRAGSAPDAPPAWSWAVLDRQLSPGSIELDGWRVSVGRVGEAQAESSAVRTGSPFIAYLPPELAGDVHRLSVRGWAPGARMRPAGMEHEKKLQDIFMDAKVPRAIRHRTPLLYLDNQCVWVVGVKRSRLAMAERTPCVDGLIVSFEQV